MSLRTDKGCGTPQNAKRKQIYQRLVQIFAPVIYFEPQERFFPVDLPSTIQKSSVWQVDSKATSGSQRKWKVGAFKPVSDVAKTTKDHYTTVAGTGSILKTIAGQSPFNMPAPLLKAVHQKYTDGTINAELTIYATVCTAYQATNSHLVKQVQVQDKDVALAASEGLIINYYMYFPARESPEFESEGDWSGISLLLKQSPQDLDDLRSKENIKPFLPVLACYYRKTLDGAPPAPHFVAGTHGFRRWANVKRGKEQSLGGLETHPFVYVSRGRHNCYYEPTTTNISLSPPWEGQFTSDRIEGGKLTPGPADNSVQGYTDWGEISWWEYVVFPPLLPVVLCGSGCEYPWHFDRSGLPTGYQEGEDRAKDGGYNGLPGATGSSHPKQPAGKVPASSRQISLRLRYVDLDDATTAALWGYPGAWGGATLHKATLLSDPGNPRIWGYYQGARRPALAAWFLWNLFLDWNFGCSGKASLPA